MRSIMIFPEAKYALECGEYMFSFSEQEVDDLHAFLQEQYPTDGKYPRGSEVAADLIRNIEKQQDIVSKL